MKILLLLLLGACTSASNQATSLSNSDLHRAFWADYNQFKHNYSTAYSWYQNILASPDKPNYLYKGLLHLLEQTKQYPKILALINKLDDTFTHDVEIQMLFAQALRHAGNREAADQKILQLASTVKDNQQIAFNAAQIFFRHKEPENALLTIQDYISLQPDNPNNFIFHFLSAQIHLSLNKKELALKQLSACLALQPQFDKAWLMLALLHEQLNDIQKAVDAYETYVQIIKNAPLHIKQHIASLKNLPFDTLNTLFAQHNYSKVLELVNNQLRINPDNTQMLLFKIKTLNALQQPEQAFNVALSLIEKNPYDQLWFETLHTLAQEHATQTTMINTLTILNTTHPDSPYIALYLGILHAHNHQAIDALAHFDNAYKQATDTNIKATVLVHWTTFLHEHKLYQFMPNLIEQATTLNHDLPALHNVVAYWYATKGNNHTKSFDILKKILPQEQNNPLIADTLGKLFYKQKQFFAASTFFRRSLSLLPEHPRIMRHLAKSYAGQWKQFSIHNVMEMYFSSQNSVINV